MQPQNQRAHLPESAPKHPPLVNKNLIDHTERQLVENELKLISLCQEIGGIAERNNQYTLSLTIQINHPIESLTVAQLLAFHRECLNRFNQGVSHG